MDRCVGAAARLRGGDGKDLAIQVLAQSETVSDLAARHGVGRKFVHQQTHKARAVLDDAFSPAVPDSEVLFELTVTKAWLRQVIVGLTLVCRGSYRVVVEFLRDLLGLPVSVGCVHDMLQAATQQASAINRDQDLSGIRVGLHDDVFQGALPVLAGVDAASTSCYLLAAQEHRDAGTWACICSTPPSRGCGPITRSPMRDKTCVPGRGRPGATRRAMATYSTSSVSARAWPTRSHALPRALRRGARRCKLG